MIEYEYRVRECHADGCVATVRWYRKFSDARRAAIRGRRWPDSTLVVECIGDRLSVWDGGEWREYVAGQPADRRQREQRK